MLFLTVIFSLDICYLHDDLSPALSNPVNVPLLTLLIVNQFINLVAKVVYQLYTATSSRFIPHKMKVSGFFWDTGLIRHKLRH